MVVEISNLGMVDTVGRENFVSIGTHEIVYVVKFQEPLSSQNMFICVYQTASMIVKIAIVPASQPDFQAL